MSEKRVAPSDVSKHFQINRPPGVPEEENFMDVLKDFWLHGHDGDYVIGGKKMGMLLLPLIGMHQRDETQVNNHLKGLTSKGILPKKDKEVTLRGGIDIYTYRYNDGRVEEYMPNAETHSLQFHRVIFQEEY